MSPLEIHSKLLCFKPQDVTLARLSLGVPSLAADNTPSKLCPSEVYIAETNAVLKTPVFVGLLRWGPVQASLGGTAGPPKQPGIERSRIRTAKAGVELRVIAHINTMGSVHLQHYRLDGRAPA